MTDHRQNYRRFADRGNGDYVRDPRDIDDIEVLRQQLLAAGIQPATDRRQPIYDSEHTESDYDFHEPYAFGRDQRDHNPFGRRPNRPRSPQPQQDPLRAMGFRFDIPEFEGGVAPDDFLDWINTVERVFDLRDAPDNMKVKLVAMKLKRHASLWWEHVKKKRFREGKSRVETWDKMKRLLHQKFLPVNHRQDAFLDYHGLKQGTLSVADFILEFERLRMRCGADEDEEQVIARFLGSLRPEISEVVYLQQYFSFDDVCRLASRVEKQAHVKPRNPYLRPNQSRGTGPSTAAAAPSVPAQTSAQTPVPTAGPKSTAPGPSLASVRCFKCQGLGHRQRNCPNTQTVALVDDSVPVFDESDHEEGDDAESAVLFRNAS